MAGKRTKGVDLGLDKPDRMARVNDAMSSEIDGGMEQGLERDATGADIDPDGGTQMGSHPAKRQEKTMRFFG